MNSDSLLPISYFNHPYSKADVSSTLCFEPPIIHLPLPIALDLGHDDRHLHHSPKPSSDLGHSPQASGRIKLLGHTSCQPPKYLHPSHHFVVRMADGHSNHYWHALNERSRITIRAPQAYRSEATLDLDIKDFIGFDENAGTAAFVVCFVDRDETWYKTLEVPRIFVYPRPRPLIRCHHAPIYFWTCGYIERSYNYEGEEALVRSRGPTWTRFLPVGMAKYAYQFLIRRWWKSLSLNEVVYSEFYTDSDLPGYHRPSPILSKYFSFSR